MKKVLSKASDIIRIIFGWGIMICLFAGGLSFFGYLAALIIGGDTATAICTFIYKSYLPVIIYASTILIVLGLISMYLKGETALTANKKTASKHEGEL